MSSSQLRVPDSFGSTNTLEGLQVRKESGSSIESEFVDFDGEHDKENPLNWPRTYKWSLVVMMSALSLSINVAIMTAAPAVPLIVKEFPSTSKMQSTLLISIWELGEAIGPLFLAPLSEIFGRVPVYHAANISFVVMAVGAAQSSSIEMLIAFRFLLGLSVCTQALNYCIIGDMFLPEHRGRALAVLGILPFISACVGPAIGGAVSKTLGWRWAFWVTAIGTGALELIWVVVFRETYKVVIVERKAKRLRRLLGNSKLQSQYSKDCKPGEFWRSLVRPIKLLFTSKVVFLLSVCGGITMGYLYVVITSLTPTYVGVYGFTESRVGLSFFGLGAGMFSSIIITGTFLDWYLARRQRRGNATPEVRLPPMIVGFTMVPMSLLCMGWLVQMRTHWIAPIVATVFTGAGFAGVTLSSTSYIVDAFGIYAASASAGVQSLRCALSAVLPLAAPALAEKIGIGRGYTVLAAIALTFVPIPIVLMRYGERMRGRRLQGLSQI